MSDCLFCKIASGELGTPLVYEDDAVVAFDDIGPQAPMHVLVIPKKHIATLNDVQAEDEALLGRMSAVAAQLAAQRGFEASGFRTVMNCNRDGGQTVFHIHMHVLAGRALTWPPG